MSRHNKLGSRRIERHLVNDVCLNTIPKLSTDYDVSDANLLSILGDAPKVFLEHNSSQKRELAYIAKAPRKEGPRECVTEHIIASIGLVLPIKFSKWRFVKVCPRCGPVPNYNSKASRNFCPQDIRFMSRYFCSPNESLVHGVELVAHCFGMETSEIYNQIKNRKDERSFYTVELIDEVLEDFAPTNNCYEKLRNGFSRMMAFDALVGANDRHPQNWGVLVNATNSDKLPSFAPLFDTARGLFWNFRDSQLEYELTRGNKKNFISKYANSSTPLIGISGRDNPNHFDVIEYMVKYSNRGFSTPIKHLIRSTEKCNFRHIVNSAAGRYFSRLRLEYIVELLNFRRLELIKICKS